MKTVAASLCLLAALLVLPVYQFIHQSSVVVAEGSPSPVPLPPGKLIHI
jgi:hypothetical protein